MAKTWLNPDPNLHIDYLNGQLRIGSLLAERFLQEGRIDKLHELAIEMDTVFRVITEKEFPITEIKEYTTIPVTGTVEINGYTPAVSIVIDPKNIPNL